MDQEDCSPTESQTKSLTRSAARHIRRKRLKDALKAEKKRALTPNGKKEVHKEQEESLKIETTETTDELTDALTKSKARRLRKKTKISQSEPFCQENSSTIANELYQILKVVDAQNKSSGKINQDILPQTTDIIDYTNLLSSGDTKIVDYFKWMPDILELERKVFKAFTESNTVRLKDGELSKPTSTKEIATSIKKETPLEKNCLKEDIQSDTNIIEITTDIETPIKMVGGKENIPGKSKEEIMTEREARRAAKVAAKAKVKLAKSEDAVAPLPIPQTTNKNQTNLKENTDIVMKQQNNSLHTNESPDKCTEATSDTTNESKAGKDVKAEREARRAAKLAAKAKAKAAKSGEHTESTPTSQPVPVNKANSIESIETANIKPATPANPTEVPSTSSKTEVQVPDTKSSEVKSKAEIRAERRAKQEAQRAAKQQKQQQAQNTPQQKTTQKQSKPEETDASPIKVDENVTKKVANRKVVPLKKPVHEANLFKHLYHERELAFVDAPSLDSKIHPAIVRLGVQYAEKVIIGSNARCVALLAAIKQLLRDFERPSQADFIRGLEANLQESAAYLHHCRPSAVSMQNALRHLKWQMTQLPSTLSDMDAKSKLESAIDTYILEQIQLAGKAISITIQRKISHGDIILTYGYSSLINKILLDAHAAGKKFRVIVADGRPWLEGREQLRRLAKHGVECTYILINALSFVMPEVSKVFLGAHAILANGAVMSRVGTAQVALMARAFNVPVLVACETHKSCERVQTDSIVYNELGNPDDLADLDVNRLSTKKSVLAKWKSRKSLNLLNITYDVTPADLVSAVVTELAILPCTSVPVILRIKPSEI